MNLKLTVRDRWLCAVLPAILTVWLGYGVFLRSLRQDILALRRELRQQDPLDVRLAKREYAQRENERLTGELTRLRQATATSAGAAAHPGATALAQRPQTLRELSRLCEEAGVLLICSTPIAGTRPMGDATPAVQDLLNKAGWRSAEVWRIELRGGYLAMLRLLEGLSAKSMTVIPLGVNMEPASDDNTPISWSLTIWI